MTIKSTEYVSCGPICCGNSFPASVIICIPSTFVDSGPSSISYIRGTLGCSTNLSSVCGQKYFRYVVSFDDSQLVEGVILMGSDITGIICDNCLIQYIDNQVTLGSMADSLSATGTTQGAATIIGAVINRFTTVATGVNDSTILPDVTKWVPEKVVVGNEGAGILKVYPFSGQFIDGFSANSFRSISSGSSCIFFRNTAVSSKWQSFPN